MPSCNTYHLTWVSLNLGCVISLHDCSSKAQPLLLTLNEEYLLRATPTDLEHGVAPLWPSCACVEATPWQCGSSSWAGPLTSGVG